MNSKLGALSVVGLFIGELLLLIYIAPSSSLYHSPPVIGFAIFLCFMSTYELRSFYIWRQHQPRNREDSQHP